MCDVASNNARNEGFYLNRVQQYFEDQAVSSGDERLYMEATV